MSDDPDTLTFPAIPLEEGIREMRCGGLDGPTIRSIILGSMPPGFRDARTGIKAAMMAWFVERLDTTIIDTEPAR